MRCGKSSPEGRVYGETLQIRWSDTGIAKYLTDQVNRMYQNGKIPQAWSVSDTAQIGKNNGKEGCKAIRLINILCPLGKAIASTIWQSAAVPPYYFSYGFKAHQRREYAILVQNITSWTLQHEKMNHGCIYYDVAIDTGQDT